MRSRIAAGAAAGLLLTARMHSPADASIDNPIPELPWRAIDAAFTAGHWILYPITYQADNILELAETIALLEPIGHALAVADAALPAGAHVARLAHDLTEVDTAIAWGTSASNQMQWHLPAMPDLHPSISSLAPALSELAEATESASTCGCLPPKVTEALQRNQESLENAAWATRTFGPLASAYDDLAGFTSPITLLVLVGNQAEMRPSGGAPLYAAVVQADQGTVTLVDQGNTSSHFFAPNNRPVTWIGDDSNPFLGSNPRTAPFVNAGFHPDFSISAPEYAAAFEAGGYPRVDGIVFVDLSFLASLLALTGPITTTGLGSVDHTNLVDALLTEQYLDIDSTDDNFERQETNDEFFTAVLTTPNQGVEPVALLKSLDRAAKGRHMQAWFRQTNLQEAMDKVGWTGRLTRPNTGDWLAWFTQSANASKTDLRQRREAIRNVVIQDGTAHVTTDYRIFNDNPAERREGSESRRGYRATWMKTAVLVYLPEGAQVVRSDSTGALAPAQLAGNERPDVDLENYVMRDERKRSFIRFVGWIAPGGSKSFRISYALPVTRDENYRLTIDPNPAFSPNIANVSVSGADQLEFMGPITQRTELATHPG